MPNPFTTSVKLDVEIKERVRRLASAVKAIRPGTRALGKHPEIGRPVEEMPPEFREW
jgi:plasmid stabilization system protein ParE